MWWGGVKHVAGEHQAFIEDMNWYGKSSPAHKTGD